MEGGKSKQNKERGTGVDICPLEGEIPTESRTFLSGKDKRDWFNK